MPDDHTVVPPLHAGTAVTGGTYELPVYPFVEPAELRGQLGRHPVVIVGAGLTGLTAACDFALRGIPAVVIDEDDTVGVRGASSRGICYAQKSLEIFERLGVYERIRAKGVQWSVGRTIAGRDEVYRFDLKTMPTHDASEQPPFINLQQFYVEWFLVDRLYELGIVELRWKNRLAAIEVRADHVIVDVDTPAGPYRMQTQWLVDCTGANSPVRRMVSVGVETSKVLDRWCISDVRFDESPPAERWTWIEAPFNDDRAVWQHLMADNVWRLDYQMAPDADPDEVSRPEVVADRVRRQFGAGVEYELVWVGPYAYRSQCLSSFRVGRVLFAGDAAHVMSPFGARGGNSGIQDADNLVWKLSYVLQGRAPERLLDSFDLERRYAAQDNIRITNRTTRFLSPPTPRERTLRDAVLSLAREFPFARAFVNTGRLSAPTAYVHSPLAVGSGGGGHVQNVALELPDGTHGDLVALLARSGHALLVFLTPGADRYLAQAIERLEEDFPVRCYCLSSDEGSTSAFPTVIDADGRLARQLGGAFVERPLVGEPPMAAGIVRPDLHLAGVIEEPSGAALERALRTVLAMD